MSFLLKCTIITLFFFVSLSVLNEPQINNNYILDEDPSLLDFYSRNFFENSNEILLNYNESDFKSEVIAFFASFWANSSIIPYKYIFDKDFIDCFLKINSLNSFEFRFFAEGTAKHMNDLGNEFFCRNKLADNATYYLLQAYLEDLNKLTNYEDGPLLHFLNQNFFYVGICLPNNCSNIVYKFIDKEKSLLDYLYWQMNISNFTITNCNEISKGIDKDKSWFNLVNIIYIIIGIKIIFGLFRIIKITGGYERYYLDNLEEQKKKNNISLILIDSKIEDDDLREKEVDENKELIKNESKEKKTNKSSSNLTSDKNNNEIKDIYFDYIYGASAKNEYNLYNPFYDNQDNYPLKIKILKYIDIFDNLKTLTTLANKYYNSCNIKKINFLKCIVMFMAVVHKVMLSQMQLPSRNFLVYNFYKSFFFCFIKLCAFSPIFWIVLDATTVGFKLMSYIKKKIGNNINNNLSFVSFLKFLLLLIPKIVIFYLCFYFLYINSDNLTISLINLDHIGPFIHYNSIRNNTFTLRNTISKNYTNDIYEANYTSPKYAYLFPLWINYIDYLENYDLNKYKIPLIEGDDNLNINNASNYTYYKFEKSGYKIPSPFLTNTELFVNVYFNEFVLLIFMVIITYLSYKIRKKIFDYILLMINIFLYILPFFNFTPYNFENSESTIKNTTECYYDNTTYNSKCFHEEIYDLQYVLGQNFSEKYTHYFINFYYFGFLIGVMMFYYNENMLYNRNNNNVSNNLHNSHSSENSLDKNENINNNNNLSSNILHILPFSFCNDIIMFISKIKLWIKNVISVLCIIFILLISNTFLFVLDFYANQIKQKYKENDYDFPIILPLVKEPIVKFIFLGEKNICCIFFFLLLMMFIVLPNDNIFVKPSNLNIFIIFDRINFAFFCSFSYFVYGAFCFFYVDLKITYIDIFLHSLGLFIILIIIGTLIVCIVELPIRMIVKTFMNRSSKEEFRLSMVL